MLGCDKPLVTELSCLGGRPAEPQGSQSGQGSLVVVGGGSLPGGPEGRQETEYTDRQWADCKLTEEAPAQGASLVSQVRLPSGDVLEATDYLRTWSVTDSFPGFCSCFQPGSALDSALQGPLSSQSSPTLCCQAPVSGSVALAPQGWAPLLSRGILAPLWGLRVKPGVLGLLLLSGSRKPSPSSLLSSGSPARHSEAIVEAGVSREEGALIRKAGSLGRKWTLAQRPRRGPCSAGVFSKGEGGTVLPARTDGLFRCTLPTICPRGCQGAVGAES